MRAFITLSSALFFAACSDTVTETQTPDLDNLPKLSLRATGDIYTPETMVKAAFIPNPVTGSGSGFSLSLPGEIILLSDTGSLWVTTTEGEEPTRIAEGDFINVTTVPNSDSPAIVLAALKMGSISAFAKTDGSDAFNRLTLSYSGEPIQSLCENSLAFIGEDGNLHTLSGAVSASNIAELSSEIIGKAPKNAISCRVTGDEVLSLVNGADDMPQWQMWEGNDWANMSSTNGLTDLSAITSSLFIALTGDEGQPLIIEGNTVSTLSIEDGLSIRGLDETGFVISTAAAMGTTFSNGLILLSDKTEDRLVMISLEYAQRELGNE